MSATPARQPADWIVEISLSASSSEPPGLSRTMPATLLPAGRVVQGTIWRRSLSPSMIGPTNNSTVSLGSTATCWN